MPWDLALPLLVCLVTLILFGGIYWSAKKLLVEPREEEGVDAGSRSSDH